MLRRKGLFFILTIVVSFLFLPVIASAASDTLPSISIIYFYNNPCGSCDDEGKFYDQFNKLVGKAKEGVAIEVSCRNTFRSSEQDKFLGYCRKYGIPSDKQVAPIVFINSKPLIGKEDIEKNLASVFKEEKQKIILKESSDSGTISKPVYFYVTPCEECAAVKSFIGTLPAVFTVNYGGKRFESPMSIDSYSITVPKNLELVKKYFQAYNVPDAKQKVPIIFLKDGYLSGKEEIISGLETAVESGRSIGMPVPDAKAVLKPYEWSGILLTGLLNGFNPCSVSMLLFLITLLLARKVSILKMGFLFIFGKFVAYMVLGLFLYNLLASVDNNVFRFFSDVVKYFLLAISILVAVLNIKDFVAAKNEKYNNITLQLPVRLRKLNHSWLRAVSKTRGSLLLCFSFALGIIISIGEFLCTGQIYLATILYLLKRNPNFDLQTLGAFLGYTLSMLLPLIFITLAIHKGHEVFDISELARRNMPLVKLINAVVFIVFCIIIFRWF